MNARRAAYAVSAGALAVIVATLAWQRSDLVEARRLEGAELLGNLRGYLEVGRLDEAAEVLTLLIDPDCLDQARYEIARSYVVKGGGEKAIALLDKVSLHDRSFDFQRAVLREKIRAVFSFFFDPTGDLRAPAQIADYVYHSEFNPDPKLRPTDPAGHEDSNALLDYFDRVASQIEDVMRIQGLERADEPALAESYDAIQILLYGRGVIGHAELASRLASSPSGESARTLYLLGNQHFTEADYVRAFERWGDLLSAHPASAEALRAFSKVYELFEARARLADAFAFWPIKKPAWLVSLAGEERFARATEAVRAKLDAHRDLARYKGVTHGALAQEAPPVERELFEAEHDIDAALFVADEIGAFDLSEADPEEPLILERDHSLGWRLQTEFREFLIKRSDNNVFTPSAKKTFVVRTSFYGEVIFEARRFASGDAYNDFSSLDSRQAVAAAAALPVAKTWTEDLGPLADNGKNVAAEVRVPLDAPGFYLISARARYAPVVATTQIAIVAEKVLTWSSPEEAMFRVVAREDGRPVEGAKLRGRITPVYRLQDIAPKLFDGTRTPQFLSGLETGFREGRRDELVTDNDDFLAGFAAGLEFRKRLPLDPEPFEAATAPDGLARVTVPEKWKGIDCVVTAELGALGSVMPISARCSKWRGGLSWRALFYAERPIFRPGEKVRVKGMIRRMGPAGPELPPLDECEFMLWHGSRLHSVVRATPNGVGTVALEMALSPNAEPGAYHVTVGHSGTRHPVFRVDRGERPLVDVSVVPDAGAVYAGSTVRGRVVVKRAGLVPAAGMKVELKVYRGDPPALPQPKDAREAFFDTVRFVPYPEAVSGDILGGRLRGLTEVWTASGPTDARGEYQFAFASDAGRPARYIVLARVATLPHRHATARAEILTSDTPVFLEIRPERSIYYPGETLRAAIETRALSGERVPVRLRVEVTRTVDPSRPVTRTDAIETDEDGSATLSVALGKRAPSVRVGVLGTSGWAWRPVPFELRQIGASSAGKGIRLSLDRKAYYPGETARVTIEIDRPGADVMLAVSRERVRHAQRFVVEGTTGTFDVPITEADAPNVFFYAGAVWDDAVHTATVEIPVVPANRFLKIEVLTDREDYASGDAVSARVRVLDWKGRAVPNAEVSLAAVLSSAYVLQEDLTPDLARYFLNTRLPLQVALGGGGKLTDSPRSESYWLAATFAWGVYSDLVGNLGVGGGGAGAYGFRGGGGRKRCALRGGGSRRSEASVEAYAEFLRQHGLTLFWEARLVTDAAGEARVEFTLPDRGGEFRFTARALTPGTLVGEIRSTGRFRRDVLVQAPWPLSIREGERFSTPVFVVNGSDRPVAGTLSVTSDLVVIVDGDAGHVEVPPGGVARVDVEIDARKIPDALLDPGTGALYPTSYAHFKARFAPEGGRETASEAMVEVRAAGIPVERVSFAVVRAGEGERRILFDTEKAVARSALVEVKALQSPEDLARWLLGELAARAGDCSNTARTYAWAAEAFADTLAPEAVALGKTLPMEASLVGAFAYGVTPPEDDERPAYFLAFASARRRGVRLPSEWAERQFEFILRGAEANSAFDRDLWALAEYTTASDGKPERRARVRSLLVKPLRGNVSGADAAYYALALAASGARTRASAALDQALADALVGRRSGARARPLEESAALLLAGVRLSLDTDTLGTLYEGLLDSLSRTPRPCSWESAVATHALVEWAGLAEPQKEPIAVRVAGVEHELAAGKSFAAGVDADTHTEVIVVAPKNGLAAVRIACAFRVRHEDLAQEEGCFVERVFARLDRDGNALLLEPGDPVRLGEALMVLAASRGPLGDDLVVPGAGPWTPVAMPNYPKPTRPALKEFIASPRRRARVLAAVEEKRIDDARALLVEAAEDADFEETTIACDAWRSADGWTDGPTWVLAVRPDRTGDFIAPAAYADWTPGTPVASAPPFSFRVVDSEEDIPRREAELRADAAMRQAVADALALAPDDFLEDALARVRAHLDLRPLAVMGVLMSDDPRAPDAYAALAWGRDGTAPEALSELVAWRKAMLDEDGGWAGGDLESASPAVLTRALGSVELASRGAALELIAPDAPERDILNTENAWRRALCVEARKWRALDDVPLRLVTLRDVLAELKPERLAKLYRAWDDLAGENIGAKTVRGPSLHAALSRWAESFGLECRFAEGVPDLEAGEFVLSLPVAPSVRELDRSLAGVCLVARPEGKVVTVSVDPNAQVTQPALAAALSGNTPEERLRAFLKVWAPGARAFSLLCHPWERSTGVTRYTPRVEIAADLARGPELDSYEIEPSRPLAEQFHSLARQGLRLETKGGVLRIGRVP